MARAEKLEIIGKEVTMIPKQSAKKASTTSVRNFLPLSLPKPALFRGATVFASLQKRKTVRTVSSRKLPLQVLSNLLWAACGINRTKGPFGIPGRTAGSASNSQEIEVYAASAEGVYLYDPASHSLVPVVARDLRAMAIGRGQGKWGANAPVRFIYVVNIDKFDKAGFQEPGLHDAEIQKSYYYVDTGLIAANVYLFAASLGLAAWFHNCDKAAVSAALKLPPSKRPLFGQTVGYPGKE
jgi:nitroreductase